MLMPVVNVGIVFMGMGHRLVPVRVAVRLAGRVVRAVFVLVVFVVDMAVVVGDRIMVVFEGDELLHDTATPGETVVLKKK